MNSIGVHHFDCAIVFGYLFKVLGTPLNHVVVWGEWGTCSLEKVKGSVLPNFLTFRPLWTIFLFSKKGVFVCFVSTLS